MRVRTRARGPRPIRPIRPIRRIGVIGVIGVPLVAGPAGAVLTVAGVRTPAAGPLTLVFLLFTPAVCVARLLCGLDAAARVPLAGSASLVIVSAVAETMLVASVWSVRGGVLAVGGVCLLLALVRGLRRRRRSSGHQSMP